MTKLKVAEVYRYSRPYSAEKKIIDGLPNYFNLVNSENMSLPILEAGINGIGIIKTESVNRRPAILIGSSPHKIGSSSTPWQDSFELDNGYIRYFGDNKSSERSPEKAQGNKLLLEQLEIHSSPDINIRKHAVPLIFFERVAYEGRLKGNLKFSGFGVITSAERVVQLAKASDKYFVNYVFEFCILSLANENEHFDWAWINSRRDKNLTLEKTNKLAPKSWSDWIKHGKEAIERNRRKASKLRITSATLQKPTSGSKEYKALRDIYVFYSPSMAARKRFEAIAAKVVQEILVKGGTNYLNGWITPGGGDHGADFIGRIDIGSGFGKTKLVVVGQAKCEDPMKPTNGVHIARTVARLRRGWVGAYVTTSYFSEPVQVEIEEDEYPIFLVNGLLLAQTILLLVHEGGYKSVTEYLKEIDSTYELQLSNRRPEEVLWI